jgi:hypothetical protein
MTNEKSKMENGNTPSAPQCISGGVYLGPKGAQKENGLRSKSASQPISILRSNILLFPATVACGVRLQATVTNCS